ncbi:ORF6N domain-containing protein [Halopseudomonas xinjiangensis]|nr:ORF6N domain-containing protein [Halopseudomonas xinjiangensis]
MTPIRYAETDTLSLRQLDELNRVEKGTSFRAFKACRDALIEGVDYFHLPAQEHESLINELKSAGLVYATTVNLVLFTHSGYERIRRSAASRPAPSNDGSLT